MQIEIGIAEETYNTKYAPLAVLAAKYRDSQRLKPLQEVCIDMKKVNYSGQDKLEQLLLSILAGCEYISEVNSKLKTEEALAQAWGWRDFADQSSLSRCLDGLTQMNLDELAQASHEIWRERSQVLSHDGRGYLLLDLDLSGLPCSKRAEGSSKGFFSDKKTSQGAN
jgi:hypothetical protein